MKWKLETESKNARSLEGRIFPTRDAALAALLMVPSLDDLDFQIIQDGAGRASIKLMVTN
jgi:hypothetical protein